MLFQSVSTVLALIFCTQQLQVVSTPGFLFCHHDLPDAVFSLCVCRMFSQNTPQARTSGRTLGFRGQVETCGAPDAPGRQVHRLSQAGGVTQGSATGAAAQDAQGFQVGTSVPSKPAA